MGGSGTGTPDGSLSFPGAYDASSYPVNAYNFQPEEFKFVGGPLSSLANLDQNPGGSAGVTGGGTGTSASTSSSGSEAPVTTAAAASSMAATASSTTVVSSAIPATTAQSEAPQPSPNGHCRAKFRRNERRSYPHYRQH